MRIWVYIVALAAFFFGGWLLGRHYASPDIVEDVRVDTVFYERPEPYRASDITVSVNVPTLMFAPADTVDRVVVVEGRDSIPVSVALRTLEYRDSSYYARVVGPVVGDLSPRLDFIETYNITTTRTQVVREPYKWSVGPAAGAWAAPTGSGVWLGGAARANLGILAVQGAVGYDTHNEGFFGQISIGLDIWRK